MPEFSAEFWIMLITYAATFGMTYGRITTRLKYLEDKMDKHNNDIERLTIVEQSTKSAHHRIDEIKEGK